MLTLADNEKMGQYLADRIDKQFNSRRQFCKVYLTAKGEQADSEQIRKMSNRLSQILKGKKGLQLYDLPLFCRLLEVSCEDILSAGKNHAPASARLTNYIVAFSKDRNEWESHVNREDSPILNADEFGKTFIDYAMEAENYNLLKYLMDNKYIWFVEPDIKNPTTYLAGFGAGTSIEKATFPVLRNWNVLDGQLKMRAELRTQMIVLAIQHEDMIMLEQLRAREIPSLYQLSLFSVEPHACKQYYNSELIEALTHADDSILEYFSGEFEITDSQGFPYKFLFPFFGELIERLLQNKNDFAEYMLKDAIRHNQYVYDQLAALLADAVQFHKDLRHAVGRTMSEDIAMGTLRALRFYDDGRFIKYFAMLPTTKKGLKSDIIRVNAKSADTRINRRILELNDLYDAIHNIKPHFDGGKKDAIL